ncbi:MAG: hypothetical protein HY913_08850 [Desulfomonile tiedjei]|nr:hypothetical protein [Desulfomonile tiedjei]
MKIQISKMAWTTVLIALSFLLLSFLPAVAEDCSAPPFIGTGEKSNVLLILDNSRSMNGFAYNEETGSYSQNNTFTCPPVTNTKCSGQPSTCGTKTSRTPCQNVTACTTYPEFTWSCDAFGRAHSGDCTWIYRCQWAGSRCSRYLQSRTCTKTSGSDNASYAYDTSDPNTAKVTVTINRTDTGFSGDASYGYSPTKKYYGYFDPDKTYKYNNTNHYFYTESGWNVVDPESKGYRAACATGTCDKFSGNWLNWLTMRRIDIAKKVLTGGRLGGDTTEYVLIGNPHRIQPSGSNVYAWKMFNDNGSTGVHYTPFAQGVLVHFYTEDDLIQRTPSPGDPYNGAFVPLMTFWPATVNETNGTAKLDTISDDNVSLGNPSGTAHNGNPGEVKYVGGVQKREENGSYYFAVKHSTVADGTPPAGIVQNMFNKVRLGFMHFNYGRGPAEGYDLGDTAFTDYPSGDGIHTVTDRYADGGRVVHPIGDQTTMTSWQGTTIPKMVHTINDLIATTWTPLAEVMREAKNYYDQQPSTYAHKDSSGAIKDNFQVGVDTNGLDWDPYRVNGAYLSCLKSYIVLVTDGEPTEDHPCNNGCKTDDCTTSSSNCAPVTASTWTRFNGSGYLDDIAFKLWREDQRLEPQLPGNQVVSTYAIMVFEENATAIDLLSRAAIAGGFTDLNGDSQPGKPCGSCTCTWTNMYTCAGNDGYYEWDANADRSPDHFMMAKDGDQLESYIQSIFSQIALGGAAGAVATISQQTKEGDAIIRGAFDAGDPANRAHHFLWNGRLEVYWPNADGEYDFEIPTNASLFCSQMSSHGDGCPSGGCCWDAGEKLKALTDRSARTIFTYVKDLPPSGCSATAGKMPFTTDNWKCLQELMRQPASEARTGVLGETTIKEIINWTRGEVDAATGQPPGGTGYRDRKGYVLGDIVYSTPVIVGPPPLASVSSADGNLQRGTTDYRDGAEAFWDFRNYWLENPSGTKYKGRPKVAYVGANDGMIHAFLIARLKKDDNTWDYNCTAEGGYPAAGAEMWAYVPSNLLGDLVDLSESTYGWDTGCPHRQMVDLSPKAWDVFIKSTDCSCSSTPCAYPNARPSTCSGSNRCWRTIIIGGERGGGDMYFALDVTDPANPKVLWEYPVLKNLAVVYEESGQTRIDLPFRENDLLHDAGTSNDTTCPKTPDSEWLSWTNESCFDSMYFKLKTLPMSWTKAVLGRVRIPSDVTFWRYVPPTTGTTAPTLAQTTGFGDCDNKRHVAFIGTGFQLFGFSDLPSSLPDTDEKPFKRALTKPYMLALDVETGENYFQVLWPLAVKARTDAGLLPDQHIPTSSTTTYIPWAFGSPSLVDVWSNNDHETLSTDTVTDVSGTFAEDGFVDRLYIGDLRGYLYRMVFNLKDYGSGNPSNHKGMNIEFWPTKPLPAESTGTNPTTCDQTNIFRGCRQPIQSAPAISYDAGSTATANPQLRVLFGTGKFDKVEGGANDRTDLTKMSFYNLTDDIKSFNCVTDADGVKTCLALPEIAPTATYTIDTATTPATITLAPAVSANPESGFMLTGTNFGLTFGEGACKSDNNASPPTAPYDYLRSCEETTGTCDAATLLRVCGTASDPGYAECAADCKQTFSRDGKCCEWKLAPPTGGPDCCQGTCTKSCSGSPEKCSPCWSCIYDFATPGERVIGDPLIAFGLVFFTTYIPTSDPCAAGGHGWLYMLDYRCQSLGDGFNPVSESFGRNVIQLPDFGAKVDLGTGMPSEPVMDSTGEYVFVQKSDATVVKIGAGGGGGGGGGGGSYKAIQFKGWDKK